MTQTPNTASTAEVGCDLSTAAEKRQALRKDARGEALNVIQWIKGVAMKTVFITGANRGIGFETARQLARLNYFVFIGSRSSEKGRQAVEELRAQGLQHVDMVQIDVTEIGSISGARQTLESKTPVLDVLINNAGIRGEIPQVPSRVPVDIIRTVFETNFFGLIQVTQAFFPLLEKSELPVIVNVSSDLGSLTFRSDTANKSYKLERAGYAPSKTVVNAYTVALAAELRGSKFKVNCVNPGHTATAFNDYRGTKPVDQAASVLVRYATLNQDGPTGGFFSEEGETPW